MAEKPRHKQLSTYLPLELHDWFRSEADRLGLSTSEYVRRVLESWRAQAEADDGAMVNPPALGSEGVVDALAELREYMAAEFAAVRSAQAEESKRRSWWPFGKA